MELCAFCHRPVDPVHGLMVYDTIDLRTHRFTLCTWACCGRWAEVLAGRLEPSRVATPEPAQSALF